MGFLSLKVAVFSERDPSAGQQRCPLWPGPQRDALLGTRVTEAPSGPAEAGSWPLHRGDATCWQSGGVPRRLPGAAEWAGPLSSVVGLPPLFEQIRRPRLIGK